MMEAAKSSEILTHFQQTTWYTSHTTVIVKRHKLEMENKRYYITAHSVCSMNGGGGGGRGGGWGGGGGGVKGEAMGVYWWLYGC